MPRRPLTSIERAQAAKRESRSLDFKEQFDPEVKSEWPELIKDLVAMANTGGGIIVVGVCNDGTVSRADLSSVLKLDPAKITDKIESYTGVHFADFELAQAKRGKRNVAIISVGAAVDAPIAFTRVGSYLPAGESKQKVAFSKGTVYFRHGAKSEPGTTGDLRGFIDRRLDQIREWWLGRVRQVVEAPEDARVAMVQATATDAGGVPTRIKLTDDPSAVVYGKLAPDDTHPFRQKELIQEVRRRLPGRATVNSHDVLSVRRVCGITEATHPQFTHEPKWGSPQYSEAFADWLVKKYRRDRDFFEKAKAEFSLRASASRGLR